MKNEHAREALLRQPHPWKLRDFTARRAVALWQRGRVDLRTSVTEGWSEATLLLGHPDGTLGRASVRLPHGAPGAADRVRSAAEAAALLRSPSWRLPEPVAALPAVEVLDERADHDPAALAREAAAEAARAARRSRHLTLASAEVNVDVLDERLRTSAGHDCTYRHSTVSVYLLLLAERPEGPFDHRVELHRRLLAPGAVARVVEELDASEDGPRRAASPPTRAMPAVLTAQDLRRLLEPFIFHASAEAAARRLSRFREGEAVAGAGAGAPWLDLTLDALVPGGTESRPFDEDGVPGQSVPLVRGGRFVARHGTCAGAAALRSKPTGAPGNLVLPAGTEPLEVLLGRDGPVLFAEEFSDFSVSELSGDFGGELRTGRIFDGRRVTRVRGGSVSGNLFQCLPGCRPSAEHALEGDLLGPRWLRLPPVTVCG